MRQPRVELGPPAWEAGILPVNYWRDENLNKFIFKYVNFTKYNLLSTFQESLRGSHGVAIPLIITIYSR